MKELADRAQVFVVSHSANLISTVPLQACSKYVRPAQATKFFALMTNQIKWNSFPCSA